MEKTRNKIDIVSVELPINLERKIIDIAIKNLTSHGFEVEEMNGRLKISKRGFTLHKAYFGGGLDISGPVNYHLLDGIINLIGICKRLDVPIGVSNPVELELYQKSRSETPITIIIPDTTLNGRTPEEVEEISRQILRGSDKRLTLGLEFPSDPGFEDLINDPAKNLTYPPFIALFSREILGKTYKGLVEAFNRLRSEYGDRVRIKPTGGTEEEMRRFAWQIVSDCMVDAYSKAIGIIPEKHPNLGYEYNKGVLRNILELLKTRDNKVIWTSIENTIDLLYPELKREKEQKRNWINNNIVGVFLPQTTVESVILKEYLELQKILRE